jgi:ubiquinone/menaquinone biosynthesis C-methylase UbiE
MARTGVPMTGIDRSEPMLSRAVARARRVPRAMRPRVLRGDIRALPFRARTFGTVMAPYGLLQSLLRESDLQATLAEVSRVLRRGGLFAIDLVPDLTTWAEYQRRVSLRGRNASGARVTLVESVRQDRRNRRTIFDEEFIEQRGRRRRRHAFSLTFRTLRLPDVTARVERAGFRIEMTAGSYRGAPWSDDADVWLVQARKR